MNGYHDARIKVLRNKGLADLRERRGYARGYCEAMTTIMARCKEELGESDSVDRLHLYASSCLTGVADVIDMLTCMEIHLSGRHLSSNAVEQNTTNSYSDGEKSEEIEEEIVNAGRAISQRNR